MARLYAATGDAIARLEESAEAWTVELSLPGSGAQCLAVDPKDPDTVYAGLREGGVRRTVDAGRSWLECALPELMRSSDGGASWQDHRPGAQPDVHSLAWHPSVPGRAYEAGGGGRLQHQLRGDLAANGRLFAGLADGQLWESRDRGETWTALRLEGAVLGALSALASAPG
jgi:hypothetical protein